MTTWPTRVTTRTTAPPNSAVYHHHQSTTTTTTATTTTTRRPTTNAATTMSHPFSGAFIDRLRAKIFIESGRAIPRPITGFEHCLMILLIFATSLNSFIAAVELLWASFGLWVGNGETEYLGIFTTCLALNSGLWSVGTLALMLFTVARLWPAFLYLQDAVMSRRLAGLGTGLHGDQHGTVRRRRVH
ncbi:hypothetical protein CF319_g8976, partial [Tilletia indica]